MCCPKERGFNTRRNTHKPQKYGKAGDVRCCHVVEELGSYRTEREKEERCCGGEGAEQRERERERERELYSATDR